MSNHTAPFLAFADLPALAGAAGSYDVARLADSGDSIRFIMSIAPEGGDACTVRAVRDAAGVITVTAEPEGYEPVVEDGMIIGLRFPGCDRYPWRQA